MNTTHNPSVDFNKLLNSIEVYAYKTAEQFGGKKCESPMPGSFMVSVPKRGAQTLELTKLEAPKALAPINKREVSGNERNLLVKILMMCGAHLGHTIMLLFDYDFTDPGAATIEVKLQRVKNDIILFVLPAIMFFLFSLATHDSIYIICSGMFVFSATGILMMHAYEYLSHKTA